MGWSYRFWLGNFYPEGLKSKEFLTEYSKHFDTVELDSTFYRIPRPETVIEWKNQTRTGFLFAAKFPRIITHIKMLKDCEELVERFFGRLSELQEKLGPLLLQLPPRFNNEHIQRLTDFLSVLPSQHRFAVEVRHPKLLGNELYSLLRNNEIALTLVSSSFMPRVEELTANFVYIRLEGDRTRIKGTLGKVEVDRTEEIKKWAEKIVRYQDSHEVFVYFSKYYSGHPPTDATKLTKFLHAGSARSKTGSQ